MDNTKGNIYYIRKMIADLEFLIKHTREISYKELAENEILIDSIMFRLIQISENSTKLADFVDGAGCPGRMLSMMKYMPEALIEVNKQL